MRNNLIAQRQGQPVLFLCLLVAGWFLLRILTWDNPWHEEAILSEPFMLVGDKIGATYSDARQTESRIEQAPSIRIDKHKQSGGVAVDRLQQIVAASPRRTTDDAIHSGPEQATANGDVLPRERSANAPAFAADRRPDNRDLMGTGKIAMLPAKQTPRASKWRVDAWLLLREGSAKPTDGGLLPASYGGSQVGAVLSYRFAASSARRPAVYFRANRAIGTDRQTDGAMGLRVRPVEHVPVDIHVEARVTHRSGSTEIRPAAFVAGGFDELELPMDLRARGYGQAGYVGGDFATPFADGAVVAEREARRSGSTSLSIGGGMWGGAQKDASRFDVGPTVAIETVFGKAPVRIETGYRLRVGGNAAPGDSGVLTLSTGF